MNQIIFPISILIILFVCFLILRNLYLQGIKQAKQKDFMLTCKIQDKVSFEKWFNENCKRLNKSVYLKLGDIEVKRSNGKYRLKILVK